MAFARKEKKSLYIGLQLTSLIDCLSILVIYLLVTTTLGQNTFEIPKGMTLPSATQGAESVPSVVVEVRGQQYVLDGQKVPMNQLTSALKKKFVTIQNTAQQTLLVQADQGSNYGEINPLVVTALSVGFKSINFAVLKESDQ